MTIKQFAAEHGITEQAVYKKLRNRGIKTTELRNHENTSGKGELSEEGLNLLTGLFKNKPEETTNRFKVEKRAEELEEVVRRLTDENTQLKQELAEATERETSARNTADQLATALATMTATQEKLVRLADQAQHLQAAAQLKALPGGGVRNWFSKLFNRKGDGE